MNRVSNDLRPNGDRLAVVAKLERSFLILQSVLLGAFVLCWTIGSLAGLNEPMGDQSDS